MPLFGRSSLPTPPSPEDDLTTPEELAVRQRRRRLLWWGSGLLVALLIGWFAGRPALRSIKIWQARRAATEALRLLDTGKPDQGVVKLQDALALRGTDLEVMRAAAVFLTKAGHGREAVSFWQEIEKKRSLSRSEQRDYAADLLQSGDPTEAERRLRLAVPNGAESRPENWALEMQIAARGRNAAGAVKLARQIVDSKSAGVTARQRFDAALILTSVNDPASRAAGAGVLQALADDHTQPAESFEALLVLARQKAQAIAAQSAQHQEVSEAELADLLNLATRIENHPRARVAHKLLADSLRINARPAERAKTIQAAVEKYRNGKDDELAELGEWLYAQGEFQRALEVIPPERATANRTLYLQYLDTLGALGRWDEIQRAIESHRFTLDPLVEQMYLARCARQLQHPESAEIYWSAALRIAGTNVDKSLSLGRYAQADGNFGVAEAAYRAAVQAAPENRAAHEALVSVLDAQGHTRELRDAVHALLARWPDDTSARNDEAYLGALLGENLPASRDTVQELVRLEPQSLPHRVALALAELRLGHDLTALETLRSVTESSFAGQPRFQAVYAAVLWKTDYHAEARALAKTIPRDRLLPEERQLLESIQ